MITKYKAVFHWRVEITTEQFLRETEHNLYTENNRKVLKLTDRIGCFDTWEQAHKWLMEKANWDVLQARNDLYRANSLLGNVKGIKKTKDTP